MKDKYKEYESINKIILKRESDIFDSISNDISSWSLKNLEKYVTFLKYSDDDRKCKFLKETYNIDSGV